MKKQQRTKVSHELKQKIILASLDPGCSIVSLANKHKLAPSTIKKWRVAYKKTKAIKLPNEHASAQFVEVTAPPLASKIKDLQKVELQFAEYRCQLEGSLQVSQLLQIVKILGGGSC